MALTANASTTTTMTATDLARHVLWIWSQCTVGTSIKSQVYATKPAAEAAVAKLMAIIASSFAPGVLGTTITPQSL